jgi:hypothetical protein
MSDITTLRTNKGVSPALRNIAVVIETMAAVWEEGIPPS